MPDIDRTQVVIETSIDSSKALKKIDNLEKKLNDLEKPRTINASFDKAIDELQKELTSVNHQISDMFKSSKGINNIPGMGGMVERKSALQNALAELKKEGPGISPAKLTAILNSVQFKVKEESSGQDKGNNNQSSSVPNGVAKAGKSGGGSGFNFGKLAGAVIGIQTVVNLIRRVAAQNDNLNQAVQNVINILAAALEPALNALATAINTIAVFIGKIFGVSAKTAKSTADTATATKTLAGFDEINNIGGSSGGSAGGGGISLGTSGEVMSFLDALFEHIKGWIDVIIGLVQMVGGLIGGVFTLAIALTQGLILVVTATVGAIVASIVGVVSGVVNAIIAFIQGIFNTVGTLIQDLIGVITGMFKGFIDGFNKAREDGHGIIISIFLGLWNAFKETLANIWKLISDLFVNLWDTIKNTFSAFVTGFKNGFKAVWDWFSEKLLTPIMKSIENVKNTAVSMFKVVDAGWERVKSGFRRVINGFIGMVNSVIGFVNKIPGVRLGYLSYMASGGFPNTGQMFIANEAGPELVGQIGNRNAVVNNDQIVASVSRGVAEAVSSVLGKGGQEVNIYLDSRVLGSAVVNYINRESRVLGTKVV